MKKYLFLITVIMALSVKGIVAQEVRTYDVGDYQVSILSEGGHEGGTNLLAGATPEMLKRYLPSGTFWLETQAFLVCGQGKIILVDTGYGRNLFDNLQSLNVSPGQIDAVLLTHMHGDHIGGLLREGKIMFPNADLYVAQPEYDYWIKSENQLALSVLAAYKEQLKLFVPEELGNVKTDLFPGIQGIAAYGHTPGHTAYMIESEDAQLLIWGDLVHSPIQFPCPEVTLTFDVNQKQAAQTRKLIFDYVSQNKIRIAGMHLQSPAIANIVKVEDKGYAYVAICGCELH
jgi:glyoxylase-like metal-dependent hydrolase (beta-lactamase superfamily II)